MNKNMVAYLVTTLDTKGEEIIYVKNLLEQQNIKTKVIDVSTQIHQSQDLADISAITIASYHLQGKEAVFCGDRGKAITAMSCAFERYISQQKDVGAILGLGGSGGTALITPAMQSLPVGVAKLMVSTMASGDISSYIGSSDIAMLYSVTDISGLNIISRKVLNNAAHFIAGAMLFDIDNIEEDKPAIGLTMFGVTTQCVQSISSKIDNKYDCLIFHATGSGGKAMEKLADSRLLSGIIDITTTEVCDFLFDGVLPCDADRFGSIIRNKIPYIASCGALDMINFGHPNTIPEKYHNRQFYKHNSQVTLMRTTIEENIKIATWIANKLNQCEGDVIFIIPEGGFSALDIEDGPFWDPKARQAFIDTFESTFISSTKRKLIKTPYHINSTEFCQLIVEQFNQLIK